METETKGEQGLTPNRENKVDTARRWAALGIAAVAIFGIAVLFIALWSHRNDSILGNFLRQEFPTIAGLPFASITGVVVVTLFRQREAPLKFEVPGLKMEGSAGEIILWIACFLAVVVAFHVLWVPLGPL